MKRLGIWVFCVVVAVLISGRSQEPGWKTPYVPTRLDWLVLQCNIHHPHRYDLVHTNFVAAPPNTVKVVFQLEEQARRSHATLRDELAEAAKAYVRNCAKAHGWTEPLEVQATEIYR